MTNSFFYTNLIRTILLVFFVLFNDKVTKAQKGIFPISLSQKVDQVKIAIDENVVTEWFRDFSGLDEVQLGLLNSRVDLAKNTHYKFKQYFHSLPVQKSMINIHVNSDGIYYLNGMLFPIDDVALTPGISKEEALKIAFSLINGTLYAWQDSTMQSLLCELEGNHSASYYPDPILCYVPDMKEGKVKLAYQMDLYCLEPLQKKRLYLDALNGALIAKEELLHSISKLGKAHTLYSGIKEIMCDSLSPTLFHLSEDTRGGGIATFNAQKTYKSSSVNFDDDDNIWNNVNADRDEVATDIHWGLEMTYDYYTNKLMRNSYDDKGQKLIAMAHVGVNLNNAYFDGKISFFGDGDGIIDNPWASLDLCAHEISHGMTKETADLYYMDEMGALNESFSDIFGKCVEYYYGAHTFNWKFGDAIRKSGIGVRDFKNPHATSMPKYYRGKYYYTGTGDFGGVHTNSNVQNFWFYLLCEGGSGIRELDAKPYNVKPIGLAKAEQIAYSNLVDYLFPFAQFKDAATNSLMATESLYGLHSEEYYQVREAWYAVGIFDSPLSILDLNGDKGIKVFPNSAADFCTVMYPDKTFELSLFNSFGQLMQRLTNQRESSRLSLNQLNSGLYIVQVKVDGEASQIMKLWVSQ
jgi:bacillolysin